LLTGAVTSPGLDFEIELLDVQELNDRLVAGEFDVAKASYHAALLLSDTYCVLPAGSALGFGVGPLLLSRHDCPGPREFEQAAGRPPVVLCPGALTTATLLYRMFYPGNGEIRQVVFSEIMPALAEARADYGVCIHEGRFTWQASGLHCAADLGELWEKRTGQPLPLGGILARRDLGQELLDRIGRAIRLSIEYGLSHRQETLDTMRRYAQEFDDDVLFAHVDLYVNRFTIDLDAEGRAAVDRLGQMARESGVVPADMRSLEISGGQFAGTR
jgi:1,4-dihydroxy-6-naphthoate synthase